MDRSCSAVTSPSLTRFARLEEATGVFFDAGYMEHLMSMGLWYKARTATCSISSPPKAT